VQFELYCFPVKHVNQKGNKRYLQPAGQVDDLVDITYTQAFAVAVAPAAPLSGCVA
jgi:hypothetical protein